MVEPLEPISERSESADPPESSDPSAKPSNSSSGTPATEVSNKTECDSSTTLPDVPLNGVPHKKVSLAGDRPSPSNVTNEEPALSGVYSTAEHLPRSSPRPLCSTCKTLDLKVDKFLIGAEVPEPSSKRQDPRSSDANNTFRFAYNSSNVGHELGRIGDILTRSSTCPFCYLIIKSVTKDGEHHIAAAESLRDVRCILNWEIDGRGRTMPDQDRARTRRIHLQWSDDSLEDSYLVYVAPARYANNSDAKYAWRARDLFLGRSMQFRRNNEVLMKSWLDLCSSEHQGQCVHTDDERFETLIDQSFFGVVDVLDMCLTPLPSSTRGEAAMGAETWRSSRSTVPQVVWSQYSKVESRHAPFVALSYVWGKSPRFTTNSSNILRLREQGALESHLNDLPKVVVEAIQLTRRLGLRYIWIDSLCIVQDSRRSWKLNAQSMDLIYGSALLTICAADGDSADVGLKALNPTNRRESQYMAECAPGVRLMVSRLAETRIKHSTWNSRAWVFQERMLSKRCLIFAEGYVFFQCRSTTMSEDIVSEPEGSGWSLDLINSPSQLLRDLEKRAFWVYSNCVSLYSSRHLTKPEDILAAFEGVANHLNNAMKAPFVFGLPSSHFDLALLWEPLEPVERRWTKQSSTEPRAGERSDFPSWSWCGWSGATIEYKHSFLFENVHEWLCRHTWISWYIRDGHGDLRPLWDQRQSCLSRETEERWRGYGAYEPHVDDATSLSSSEKRYRGFTPPPLSPPRRYDYDGRRYRDRHDTYAEEIRPHSPQGYDRDLPYRGRHQADDISVVPYNRATYESGANHISGTLNYKSRVSARTFHQAQSQRRSENEAYPEVQYYNTYRPVPPRRSERKAYQEQQYYGAFRPVPTTRHGEEASSYPGLASGRDEYGRWLEPHVAKRTRHDFYRTVPESPFRVNMAEYTGEPDKEFSDHPLLQFYTWGARFHVLSQNATPLATTGLHRYNIADEAGDWCGTIVLDSAWVKSWRKNSGRDFEGSKHDFLAISEAKYFTEEECNTWTYYIPKQRRQSEWDVYFVILVEKRNMISYRVGLGKVFKTAFFKNDPEGDWREVVLG